MTALASLRRTIGGENTQLLLGYPAVSGLCLLLSNTILIVADLHHYKLLTAVLTSFCITALVGYILHSIISFKQPLGIIPFTRYIFAMAANIPAFIAITWLWQNGIGLSMSLSGVFATACMVLLNFLLCRWAVTPNRRMRHNDRA